MRRFSRLAPAAALVAALSLPATAQERPNLMIVLDASGSMWGQVGGRTKIELAREALSSVLTEATPEMDIGMLAYGHRMRGQCSDIELLVPMGPAAQAVPAILGAAARLNPRGMTPLTDAVMQAAQSMGYTEQAATVVLLTDGIETCAGDPCALGRMLAAQGIDFRAHVVGFDLTNAEQRQVSCLAEETGGMFLAANDATGLRDALARTLSVEPRPEPEPEPTPVLAPRRIDLILRDVAGGPVLTGRPFRSIEFQPLDDSAPTPGRLDLNLNPGAVTGQINLTPGRYRMLVVRQTEGRNTIRIALPVDIPQGTDPHTLDLVIAARLRLNAFVHAGQPMLEANTRIPRLTGQGRAEFAIHPLVDGAIDASVDYGGINSRDIALPPGEYFIRGTLTDTFTRERLVSVAPGVTTTVDFDFGAAPVSVDLRDAQGFGVDRMRVQVFDLDAAEPFAEGLGRDRTSLVPVFLPEGNWRIVAREDRGGAQQAEAHIRVVAGQPLALTLTPGMRGDPSGIPEDAVPNCLSIHRRHGCVAQAVTPLDVAGHLNLSGGNLMAQTAPRFTGTWQTHGGMMALVQDGRRVWGEIHVNGGIGLVWGHVSPDGLTLRGAMDRSSSPRGVMELRIDTLGNTLSGVWDHNIGRMSQTVTARRLSGGVPPLARATGTEDDLRMTQRNEPWAPADSADFAAFMELALASASPDTGDDIDAMQAVTGAPDFTGTWNTNNQQLTLQQEGRRVWGRRDRGMILGEVSADGQTMRGVWINANEWGLLEFRMDTARMAFEGAWGRLRDGSVSQRWNGTRISWLVRTPEHVALPADATGDVWESFMFPVRDPDLVPASDTFGGIGTLDILPSEGIFATMADRPGEALADAFARLFDGSEDGRMAQSCAETPWVLHPDGLMVERMLDTGSARSGGPAYRTTRYQRCQQSGPLVFCDVFQRPLANVEGSPSFDYRAVVVGGPEGSFALQDPDSGRAMLYRECRGSRGFLGELDRWPDGQLVIDTMFQREDRDGASVPSAPVPAGDLSPLPPGLWHAEAPWSDPMPAPGTAAYAERCFDEISATWPDGVTLGFQGQQTATGPEFFAFWAEECRPSGDPEWPYSCRAEDANTSDAVGSEASTSRMRIEAVFDDRVELTLLTEYDPAPNRIVLHSCLIPGGIDLTGDPRGRALARALAEARPGLPAPITLSAGVAGVPLTPSSDLRPGLDGLWFPLRDGRSRDQLTDDEARELCFDSPARFHTDGLFMVFRTENGDLVTDSHMRCDAGLACDFMRGSPSQGQPVQGRAQLTLQGSSQMQACLNRECLTIGQCPTLDWSARERSSGLAGRWEAAVGQRD